MTVIRRHTLSGETSPASQGAPDSGVYVPGYFETRLAPSESRSKVWKHLCNYLTRWIAADADVLELGAGWCDFANHV